MGDEAFVTTVMSVVSLLFVAALSAVIMKRIHFPYTVGLVVVGVGIAFIADDHPELNHALDGLKLESAMIMFLFVPILIFESAFKMDVRLLLRNVVPSLVFAGPGLLLSAALIGTLVHWLTPLPLASALIFGCLISATDPVAVIALFKDVGAPPRLNTLVEGESVFNDATAIVTFQIALAVVATGILDVHTVLGGVGTFFAVFLGGLVVGLVFGYAMVRAIPVIGDDPLIHITLTLTTAYGAFIVADHFLNASGIMAVLGAGLTIGYYGPSHYKQRVRDYLTVFWEDAAFVANSLIFLMLGLSEKVFLAQSHNNVSGMVVPVLIVIGLVVLTRAVVVFGLTPVLNALPRAEPISWAYRAVMFWGGLRGAVAIALAMSLPPEFPFRWQIIDFTFGVTLFSLLVHGTTMSWLIQRLELDRPTPVDELMAAYTRAIAHRQALDRLNDYRPVFDAGSRAITRLRADYTDRAREADDRLQRLRGRIAASPGERTRLLWVRAFAIQRQELRRRVENGLLTIESLHDLESALNTVILDPTTGTPLQPGHTLLPLTAGKHPLNRLLRALPDLPWLRRWRNQRPFHYAEELAALTAASRAVVEELPRLRDFSQTGAEDVSTCREFFDDIGRKAAQRLEDLAAQTPHASEVVYRRLVDRAAFERRLDAVQGLVRSGGIPEQIAVQVEQELDEERSGVRGEP